MVEIVGDGLGVNARALAVAVLVAFSVPTVALGGRGVAGSSVSRAVKINPAPRRAAHSMVVLGKKVIFVRTSFKLKRRYRVVVANTGRVPLLACFLFPEVRDPEIDGNDQYLPSEENDHSSCQPDQTDVRRAISNGGSMELTVDGLRGAWLLAIGDTTGGASGSCLYYRPAPKSAADCASRPIRARVQIIDVGPVKDIHRGTGDPGTGDPGTSISDIVWELLLIAGLGWVALTVICVRRGKPVPGIRFIREQARLWAEDTKKSGFRAFVAGLLSTILVALLLLVLGMHVHL